MTTQTRQATVTAYYLGRPAALWRTALTPRDDGHEKLPRDGQIAARWRP
jgi:hypothetical protein